MSAPEDPPSTERSRLASLLKKFLGRDGVHRAGVRGWLLLICVSLVILNPLIVSSVYSLLLTNIVTYSFNLGATPMVIAGYITVAGNTAICGYGIYAGYALWNVRPNAVKIVKRFLVTLLTIPIFINIFLIFATREHPILRDYTINLVGNSLWTLFYFGIFVLIVATYFDRSGRVANTYH